MANKVILAGGSGFIGTALAHTLAAHREVVILTRRPNECHVIRDIPGRVRAVEWDGVNPGRWVAELEGAEAVVNLAGRSINCVHTPANRRVILESRLAAVRALGRGLAAAAHPPRTWVQCGATGFYGDAGDRVCDETQPAGAGFLADVCRQWEEAFATLDLPGVRRVGLRIGVVLDPAAGPVPALARLTRAFLGGSAGSGRQYLSWVHREDLLRIFSAVLDRADLAGTFNACSPGPVTNAELMRTFRTVLGRPWCPPAPAFVVRLAARYLMKTDSSLVLEGQRAVPARLEQAGFKFDHPEIGGALGDLLGRVREIA